jgi:hypothetical protein
LTVDDAMRSCSALQGQSRRVENQVFCFADAEHVAAFRERLGGEQFDPCGRGKGGR